MRGVSFKITIFYFLALKDHPGYCISQLPSLPDRECLGNVGGEEGELSLVRVPVLSVQIMAMIVSQDTRTL